MTAALFRWCVAWDLFDESRVFDTFDSWTSARVARELRGALRIDSACVSILHHGDMVVSWTFHRRRGEWVMDRPVSFNGGDVLVWLQRQTSGTAAAREACELSVRVMMALARDRSVGARAYLLDAATVPDVVKALRERAVPRVLEMGDAAALVLDGATALWSNHWPHVIGAKP